MIYKALVVSALLVSGANATPNERDGGPYIGASVGLSDYNSDNYFSDVKDTYKGAFDLFAGAYINKYLSVELGYFKSGNFKAVESSTTTAFNYSAITVSALAHYPLLDDKLDLFGRFGAGQSYMSINSNSGAAMVVGAGVSYRINKDYALRAGYDDYIFNYSSASRGGFNMSLQYLGVGIEVQF